MDDNSRNLNIQSLPLELRIHIFQYCKKTDLMNMSLCNKQYRRDIKPVLWRDLYVEWKDLADHTPSIDQLKLVQHLDMISNLSAHHQTAPKDNVFDAFSLLLDKCSSSCLKSIKFRGYLVRDGLELVLSKTPSIESLSFYFIKSEEFSYVKLQAVRWTLLSSFEHLKELYIGYCNIYDKDLVDISKIRALRKLSIVGCCSVTGHALAHISQSSLLQSLTFTSCVVYHRNYFTNSFLQLKKFTNSLLQLKKLHALDLYNTDMDDRFCKHALEHLNLKSLNISWTKVSDAGLSYVGLLKGLTDLNISACNVTDIAMELICELPLRRLDISHCSDVTDAGLGHMAKIKSLFWLDIGHCSITDAGIKKLVGISLLRTLQMGFCNLTDECIDSLVKLPALREIAIAGIDFSDHALSRLCRVRKIS